MLWGLGAPIPREELKEKLQMFADAHKKAGNSQHARWHQEFADMIHTKGYIETDELVSCTVSGLKSQCGLIIFDNWSIGTMDVEIVKKHYEKCEKLGRFLGYSKAMVTHIEGSYVTDVLKAIGFKEIDKFLNRRSLHTVVLMTKDIPSE